MTELADHLRQWGEQASGRIGGAALEPRLTERGRIEALADGIAVVSGLPHARLNELLSLPGGRFGFAVYLDRGHLGCVLLDPAGAMEGEASATASLEAGDPVYATGDVVRTATGPGLLGRLARGQSACSRALSTSSAAAASSAGGSGGESTTTRRIGAVIFSGMCASVIS